MTTLMELKRSYYATQLSISAAAAAKMSIQDLELQFFTNPPAGGGGGAASGVTFANGGTALASTNVQAAIAELDADRVSDAAATVVTARTGMLPLTDGPVLFGRGNVPTGAEVTMLRENISGNFNLNTQTLQLSYFTCQVARAGVTAITVITAAFTPGAAPTLARLGLYSVDGATGDLTLLAGSTNDTALFNTASQVFTKSIASTALVKGNRYAIGALQVGAGTAPKLFGVVTVGAVNSRAPIIAGSLAGQSDLPSSISSASVAGTTGLAYAEAA